jgi:membrane protease YdiL (CAAX protease family)
VAFGLPVLLGLTLAVGVSLRTGTFDTANAGRVALVYPLSVVAIALAGGGQEEFGWRGYALPALQDRWSALTASVAIGVVWAVWHLPAFVFAVPGYTGSFGLYTLLVVGVSIVFTWLYNNTDGSILLAMLLHGGVNAASGLGALFVEDPSTVAVSPYVILVPAVWAVAAALLARYGHETLSDAAAVTTDEQSASEATEVSA